LSITAGHVVQLFGVGTHSDSDDDDGDTCSPHLVGDVSWILCILGRGLGAICEQDDDLVGIWSSSVGFNEELFLGHTESFVDTRDGTHKWDVVHSLVECFASVEVAKCNGEFGIVGEGNNS